MRTINKHFWHRTQGRRSLRTSSYHIVIFPHLLKQFSKIKLKFKYPPSFSTLSVAKCVCEKICRHWEFWNIRTGWLHWISVYRILRLDEICKMQKIEKSSRNFFFHFPYIFFRFPHTSAYSKSFEGQTARDIYKKKWMITFSCFPLSECSHH